MSTSIDHLVALDSPGERRFYPRIAPSRPIYIAFGSNNLGMLLNLSENGLLVSTPSGLDRNSVYRVSIRLNGLPKAIEVHVRTVWNTESKKRAGIQLLDLADHDREQIRKWGALEHSSEKNPEPATPQESSKRPQAKPASTPFAAGLAKTRQRPLAPPRIAAPPAMASFDNNTHLDFLLPQTLAAPRHARKKSRAPVLIAWTVLSAVICLATALFFDRDLAEPFLKRWNASAMQSAASSNVPAPPTGALDTEAPANDAHQATSLPGSLSPKTPPLRPLVPTAGPANFSSATWLTKNVDAKPSAPKTDAPPASTHLPETTETPAVSAANSADSDSVQFAANETGDALPTTIAPAPAPAPTENQAFASVLAPVAPAPSKSAIAGSIANPTTHANDSATTTATIPPLATTVNQNTMRPAWPTSGPPSAAGRASFFRPRSSSAVVHMDVASSPVTEITPPKSRTASFVTLPGERILDSPAITMHVQRSVLVPGDRWMWHSRKKVALGELSSRVDPQVSHLPNASGTITVQATIDKDGRVTNLKPLNGSFTFLPSVARAIREWRYEPTYLDNKPVETQAQIEVDFHPTATRASRP